MTARRRIRWRLRFEARVALLAAALAVLTLISREWIEVMTGWDPDNGDGTMEWLLVRGLATVAVVLRVRVIGPCRPAPSRHHHDLTRLPARLV